MVAYNGNNTIIIGCSCGCSYLEFKYDLGNLWISSYDSSFYNSQINILDVLKKRFEIAKLFFTKKEKYLTDIILSIDDFYQFVEYLKSLYSYAKDYQNSPESYAQFPMRVLGDMWKILLTSEDYVFFNEYISDLDDAEKIKTYYTVEETKLGYYFKINKDKAFEFKQIFQKVFPENYVDETEESFKPSHITMFYEECSDQFCIALKTKFDLKTVLTGKIHYALEPSLNLEDFKKFLDKVILFSNKYNLKED